MKNVLFKASGDCVDNPEVCDFVVQEASENYVVLICGCGTKTSSALKDAGYEIEYNDPHGHITKTWEERKIARDVLEEEEKRVQNMFVGKGVVVTAPILYAGSVLCHINGDNLVKAYYLGFDEIYVFTLAERAEEKSEVFKDYPKVTIKTL